MNTLYILLLIFIIILAYIYFIVSVKIGGSGRSKGKQTNHAAVIKKIDFTDNISIHADYSQYAIRQNDLYDRNNLFYINYLFDIMEKYDETKEWESSFIEVSDSMYNADDNNFFPFIMTFITKDNNSVIYPDIMIFAYYYEEFVNTDPKINGITFIDEQFDDLLKLLSEKKVKLNCDLTKINKLNNNIISGIIHTYYPNYNKLIYNYANRGLNIGKLLHNYLKRKVTISCAQYYYILWKCLSHEVIGKMPIVIYFVLYNILNKLLTENARLISDKKNPYILKAINDDRVSVLDVLIDTLSVIGNINYVIVSMNFYKYISKPVGEESKILLSNDEFYSNYIPSHYNIQREIGNQIKTYNNFNLHSLHNIEQKLNSEKTNNLMLKKCFMLLSYSAFTQIFKYYISPINKDEKINVYNIFSYYQNLLISSSSSNWVKPIYMDIIRLRGILFKRLSSDALFLNLKSIQVDPTRLKYVERTVNTKCKNREKFYKLFPGKSTDEISVTFGCNIIDGFENEDAYRRAAEQFSKEKELKKGAVTNENPNTTEQSMDTAKESSDDASKTTTPSGHKPQRYNKYGPRRTGNTNRKSNR